MSKLKSGIITFVGGLLLFCVLYLSWAYNIRWYNTFQAIFAFYGYVQALIIFYKWLRDPVYDPKHMDEVITSGKTIPDSWINPFKVVKTKEDKHGNTVNRGTASNGLSDARDKKTGSGSISGRTVETVRTGDGDRTSKRLFEDCFTLGESDSSSGDKETVCEGA